MRENEEGTHYNLHTIILYSVCTPCSSGLSTFRDLLALVKAVDDSPSSRAKTLKCSGSIKPRSKVCCSVLAGKPWTIVHGFNLISLHTHNSSPEDATELKFVPLGSF